MERLWNLYCGQSDCLIIDTELCTRVQFEFVTHPSSCVNHAFIIFFDILLLSGLLVNMICKINSKRVGIWTRYRSFSTLQIASVILNGCLGLLYIGLGTWILVMKLRNDHSASPIHWWVLYFFQGFTWALVGLTTSLKVEYFSRAPLRIFSIFAFLSAGMFCFLSLFAAIVNNQTTVKVTLDILSFLGATLLLLCTYKGFINEEDGEDNESTLYTLLNGKANGSCKFDSAVQVSPFAEAGLFSRLTFWWLNPLMKLGKLKTIKDEDIPKLRDVDRAEFCYLQFENQLNKQKQDEPFLQSSMLWTIVACHWNDILLSGFCAALKILTLSTGPLLLNAFIEVAEGKEAFKYKGYLLALALFLSKTLESLSQRQWYFRCRLIGLKVRSLLTATIYKKQLRLSNAVRMMHSAETLRLVQEPIRSIPDVISAVIQAKVAFTRIVEFLLEPELLTQNVKRKSRMENLDHAIKMRSANLYWETNSSKSTLRNINIVVRPGEKVAICGEVGSGKSTLLAAILGEVPYIEGTAAVYGKIAYVSQRAWIQTGTIRENILFGSSMNELRYQETLWRCSLIKDLDLLPFGDMTEIGERGVNLSGGQKQRIQLARALYQDADIYLLDDPFSAVDAHTATSLFSEYIMESLSGKTVLLVTHQIDFLPAFHCCLLMSDGEILQSGSYHELLASSPEFLDLVNAHKETAGTEKIPDGGASGRHNSSAKEIKRTIVEKQYEVSEDDQLIKREEREVGDTGLKPYLLYLNQNKGYMYLSIGIICHLIFVTGQILQNTWMASSVDNPHVSTYKLIVVYLVIGASSTLFLLFRCLAVVAMGLNASKSLFSRLMNSLFCAPMSFYDSTPLGRILSRVSSDLGIVDLDVPFSLLISIETTIIAYANLGVLAVITWQVLFVCIPMIYLAIRLQRYYFATAKELMRMNGTTKSLIANHLAESIAGATTIRAFEEEERFFAKSLDIIDMNASPFFHNFTASEWLIQRLETLSATVLAAAALCMVFLPTGTFSSGFIGMALSYGLSLNVFLVNSIQNQCTLANNIICVERLDQYMHIPSEAPKVIEDCRPPENWPSVGKVEICNLQIRYRPDTPLVLNGISCTFKGGNKIGIVGRTGSGKTTLIGALFRLVEPAAGKIIVDGINICSIGLHDLRSRFGIIPQDPTLFNGTVRFNLDPLCQHNDVKLWEVLGKCQLKEVVQDKEQGLDSAVMEDGSNWSMGQRQLFCLGRALLRRSRVLVLDEATASIDNATDMVLQRTIRSEFADCTVITVAHRIPTVMDCAKVLAISDGKLVEYDNPMELMKKEDSLFGQLVKEYWSHFQSAEQTH